MRQLVECVPNFSNGRDPQIYDSIANTIRGVPGVNVLDVSADPDHNRTVITFVGPPTAVEDAAFRAIELAAQLINLDEHHGEHPRIGATDVCPFIPVQDVTMADCVSMAQRVGQRVGEELGIAVYLYGEAATRPERESLSAIRKGQYELWKEQIGQDPAREPDFGPAEARSWGATVIGARPFLIAYNIFLNSSDVHKAEQIARAVRYSSGGLRYVQAKGFLVEGQAQVSMNLTNFAKTPLFRVQEMARREAERYGLQITHAELIGLTPQQALIDTARWYLQLDGMQDSQVLENQLQNGDESDENILPVAFLEATAAPQPAPGGGSAAALAGALAAALAEMVAGLTIGRKKYADAAERAAAIAEEAGALRRALTAAIAEDAAAFDAVMAAYRLQDASPERKAAAVETATRQAGEVPLRVAALAVQAAQLAEEMARLGNVNAATDAAAAALLARAAVEAAVLNVRVNAAGLKNEATAAQLRRDGDALQTQVAEIVSRATAVAAERGGY
jgi:glutamate formiminotransferase/formiminotetrahydrofolate cyclodeaminase